MTLSIACSLWLLIAQPSTHVHHRCSCLLFKQLAVHLLCLNQQAHIPKVPLNGLRRHSSQSQSFQSVPVSPCSPLQSSAQHSTAQHSTAQRSAAQHSTAQHSTAQHITRASMRQHCQTPAQCIAFAAAAAAAAASGVTRTSCGMDQLSGVNSICWGVNLALNALDKLTAIATLACGACMTSPTSVSCPLQHCQRCACEQTLTVLQSKTAWQAHMPRVPVSIMWSIS